MTIHMTHHIQAISTPPPLLLLLHHYLLLFSFSSSSVYFSSSSSSSSSSATCIIGNKSDLEDQRQVSRSSGEEFAHSLGAMFFETSALDDEGIKFVYARMHKRFTNSFKLCLSLPSSSIHFYCLRNPRNGN